MSDSDPRMRNQQSNTREGDVVPTSAAKEHRDSLDRMSFEEAMARLGEMVVPDALMILQIKTNLLSVEGCRFKVVLLRGHKQMLNCLF